MKEFGNVKLQITETGLWSMNWGERLALDRLKFSLVTETRMYASIQRDCTIKLGDNELRFHFSDLTAIVKFQGLSDASFVYETEIHNESAEDIRIRSCTPLSYVGEWDDAGLFNFSKQATMMVCPAERCYGEEGPISLSGSRTETSYWMTSFHEPETDTHFLTGMADQPCGILRYRVTPLVGAKINIGRRVVQWEAEFETLSGSRGVLLKPGGSLRLGGQYVATWTGSAEQGLEHYAQWLGERLNPPSIQRRLREEPAPTGWCSWYAGYYERITEAETLLNLEAAARVEGLDFFQIDYGWEAEGGLRTLNEPEADSAKFPRGMKWLAEQIRSRGMRPGIWVRPFLGWGDNPAYPVWARGLSLDLSHPEARTYIRNLIGWLTREWGYEYIKFDFVTFDFFQEWGMRMSHGSPVLMQPYDDTMTNLQAYRLGLEAIREGAGQDTFLLGCNCLVGPAIGIVNGNRVGDDVNEANWDRTYTMGVKSVNPLYFFNGNIWSNDPDCLMVQETMSLNEAISWVSLVGLSGQMGIVSTQMYNLSPDRWPIMQKVLPIVRTGARPVRATQEHPPAIWVSRIRIPGESEYALVGVWNWDRTETEVVLDREECGIPEGDYHVFEFWGQEYLGRLVGSELRLRLDAGDCKIVSFRQAESRPQLIGTDGHISHGLHEIRTIAWDDVDCTLSLHIQTVKHFGMTLVVPAAYRLRQSNAPYTLSNDGTLRVPWNRECGATLRIAFERREEDTIAGL